MKQTVFELEQPARAAFLFAGWKNTMIWSCLQGIMGHLYADSREGCTSAMAMLGDFCFLAGQPKEELAAYGQERCGDFTIMVPQSRRWEEAIEAYWGKKAKRITRYAMRKPGSGFDESALRKTTSLLPKGYELAMIGENLFWYCRNIPWCRDWVSQYDSYGQYLKHGLGVVLRKDGEIVSGASSYSGYLGGIEIQVDTKEEYRRRGFARICSAKLILECLRRGWYPEWDAQNLWSVRLAEHLGYEYGHAYPAYEIWRS